jgi:hypothetical protein
MFLCLSLVQLLHYFTLINTQKQVNGILRGVQVNEDGCATENVKQIPIRRAWGLLYSRVKTQAGSAEMQGLGNVPG